MNILDIAILSILIINVILGVYNGFLVTIINIIAYFASWVLAFLFYPVVSNYIITNTKLLEKIVYYTNISSRITTFEQKNLSISNIDGQQLMDIIGAAKIPHPFNKAILTNVTNRSLMDLQTLGEYFDYTVAKIIIGILSFIIIFFVVRFIFGIIIGIAKTIKSVPILKQLDGLAGAGLGIVRGVLILYILFSVLPLILTIAPIDFLLDLIESSKFASFFYKTNILTNFIR